MTREFSPELTAIGDLLVAEAGQYLKSVTRSLENLCEICALPVGPTWDRCWQCNQHAKVGGPLADRVASLIYAVEPDTQAYLTVRNYKAELSGPSLVQRMRELLAVGLRGHIQCLSSIAEAPISGWAVVPSRRRRSALRDLVVDLARNPQQEVEITLQGEPGQRELNPESWVVTIPEAPPGHVLVIDDSWVSGASAQSVASSLKRSGVEHVSVLTVARILKTNQTEIKEFTQKQLPKLDFDWRRCPWTAMGVCPD